MATENVTTKFKVDISDLKSNIQTANNQIKLLSAEMKNANAGMEKGAETADSLSTKIEKQGQIVEAEKTKLNALKEQLQRLTQAEEKGKGIVSDLTTKYQQAAEQYGENSVEAKKYAQELSKAESAQEKNRQAIERLNIQIVNQDTAVKNAESQIGRYESALNELQNASADSADSTENLNGALGDTQSDAKKAGDGFTTLKGVLADLIASGIKAAIKAFTDLGKTAVDTYKDMETGSDNLIKATGATGDKAKELEKNYKNVSKNIVADFGDIGSAIGEVNTRFGSTGKELEDLSTLYLKFSNITGENVVSAVDDTQKAMSAYGLDVDDVGTFLDALAKVSQDTGVKTSTLTSGIISNATAFQEMGLSVEQSIAFMGQLEKSGANSETVLNGMRKALKNSANDGLSLSESLVQLQESIESGKNGVDGLNASYEVFGKSGDQIYGAIKNGTLSFKDLTTASINADGAVTKTYDQTQTSAKKVKLAVQNLKVSAADLVDKVITKYSPQIEAALEKIKKVVDKVFPAIEKGFNWILTNGPKIAPIITGIGTAIATFMVIINKQAILTAFSVGLGAIKTAFVGLWGVLSANPIGLVVAAVAGLVAAFITLWNTSEDFRNFFIGIWETIKDAVTAAISAIGEFFQGALDGVAVVKEDFTAAWESVKTAWSTAGEFFSGIWTSVKSAFSSVGTWFKTTFTKAWTNVKNVFSTVGEFFGGIWDTIKSKFTDIGTKVGDAIGGAFKSAINAVLQTVENAINAVPDAINGALDIINKIPGVDIDHMGYVELPRLAKGGIVNKSTLANIGEAGEEAVIPLEHNKAGLKKIASLLANEMPRIGITGGTNGGGTVYNFTQNNTSPKSLSRYEIYRQTKNLINTIKGAKA